jgi:hypothetical protein
VNHKSSKQGLCYSENAEGFPVEIAAEHIAALPLVTVCL